MTEEEYKLEDIRKVGAQGKVTIPKKIRERFGWKEQETELKVMSNDEEKGVYLAEK